MPLSLEVVCAFDGVSRGIGAAGKLPWRLAKDMARFKRLTTGDGYNAVIMGRRTWESLPAKQRPLPNRVNVVLTRQDPKSIIGEDNTTGVKTAISVEDAMKVLEGMGGIKRVFAIGGEEVYKEAMASPQCQVLHLTFVDAVVDKESERYDAFLPPVNNDVFQEIDSTEAIEENGLSYHYQTYVKRLAVAQHEEMQYLDLIRRVLSTGLTKGDRTGVGTIAVCGAQMRFDLSANKIPLLTTKRVFWRGVLEELLWFVRGCTDGTQLSDKGVRIWEGNGSREYLDSLGLTDRAVGDLGPVYGFQWRHFGAKYTTCHADYTGQGIDQLAEVVRLIKTQPDSRRIILTAWNPTDLPIMALPPCHLLCQFFVNNGKLSSLLYQRSCDIGLGVPFNIASYSLLTVMLAKVCGLEPGEFIHTLGDAHVYSNHVEALRVQLKREPRPFPTLTITSDNTDIDGFKAEDFKLHGYDPYPAIKMEMAV